VVKANSRTYLPVVAIGASAGGLEACRALLREMPGDVPAAAFVLILHLDPTHDSMMVDLLAGHTRLKVLQAPRAWRCFRDACMSSRRVSFSPSLTRTIHLSEPEGGKGVRLPFDVLLRSLAKDSQPSHRPASCCPGRAPTAAWALPRSMPPAAS
jgi:two-component system, chemotaxis family, CheB/CheR fusion protein